MQAFEFALVSGFKFHLRRRQHRVYRIEHQVEPSRVKHVSSPLSLTEARRADSVHRSPLPREPVERNRLFPCPGYSEFRTSPLRRTRKRSANSARQPFVWRTTGGSVTRPRAGGARSGASPWQGPSWRRPGPGPEALAAAVQPVLRMREPAKVPTPTRSRRPELPGEEQTRRGPKLARRADSPRSRARPTDRQGGEAWTRRGERLGRCDAGRQAPEQELTRRRWLKRHQNQQKHQLERRQTKGDPRAGREMEPVAGS